MDPIDSQFSLSVLLSGSLWVRLRMRTPFPHHFVQSDHCDHGPGSLDVVRSISMRRIGSINAVNSRGGGFFSFLKLVEQLTQKKEVRNYSPESLPLIMFILLCVAFVLENICYV